MAGEDVAALLGRCAGGDQAAFKRLYDSQSPRLYALALRLLRQPALAADAVHDAFLQVWQRSARFDPARGNAEAWLASLLRYRAIDMLRRRGREMSGLDLPDTVSDEPDPAQNLSRREDGLALDRCLQALDALSRRAVELAFLDGMTHPELAQNLETPLGTVKSRVRRALIGLRNCLQA